MTKQDFELIARVLRETTDTEGFVTDEHRVLLAARFASELRATNSRFNRARFIAACKGEDSHDSAGRAVRYSSAR